MIYVDQAQVIENNENLQFYQDIIYQIRNENIEIIHQSQDNIEQFIILKIIFNEGSKDIKLISVLIDDKDKLNFLTKNYISLQKKYLQLKKEMKDTQIHNHTVNHPITANFYGIDDDRTYEMFGYQITDASVTPTTCMASRLGLYYIRYIKDNTLFRIRIPDALVRGTTIGDRMFSYENKCLVLDVTNKLCSYIEMNPQPKEGGGFLGLGSFFKKRQNFPDYFIGHVVNSKYVQVDENGSNHTLLKGYHSICKISGEWTNNIKLKINY